MNNKSIIRCDRAGVFFAEIKERRGSEVDLVNARRIHYWNGASECIQVAQEGIGSGSRVTMVAPEITVLGVIEVHPCSDAAAKNLEEFTVWKA